jgi:hypothetical protein
VRPAMMGTLPSVPMIVDGEPGEQFEQSLAANPASVRETGTWQTSKFLTLDGACFDDLPHLHNGGAFGFDGVFSPKHGRIRYQSTGIQIAGFKK